MSEVDEHGVPAAFAEALKAWLKVREPGDEHALLAALAGEWRARIRFHGPEPYESNGRAIKGILHGGRFLIEELTGEIHAPDSTGAMRLEPYSATRILGFDRVKNAWVGLFCENQNTSLLSFVGTRALGSGPVELNLFGLSDEPMLHLHDTTVQQTLKVHDADHHTWEVRALAANGRKVFDFDYSR